jgi:hypothetical protein
VVAGGFVLLLLCLLVGQLIGAGRSGLADGAKVFIPVWFIAAAVNLWVGVVKAGYTVAEEMPIFVFVFALPAGVALLLLWSFSRAA